MRPWLVGLWWRKRRGRRLYSLLFCRLYRGCSWLTWLAVSWRSRWCGILLLLPPLLLPDSSLGRFTSPVGLFWSGWFDMVDCCCCNCSQRVWMPSTTCLTIQALFQSGQAARRWTGKAAVLIWGRRMEMVQLAESGTVPRTNKQRVRKVPNPLTCERQSCVSVVMIQRARGWYLLTSSGRWASVETC